MAANGSAVYSQLVPMRNEIHRLLPRLEQVVGSEGVLASDLGRMLYEYDGGVDRAVPDCVVFPRSRDEVVRVIELARQAGIPLVARGAGTGLSGGSIARNGGIVLCLNRMRRVLDVDLENGRATVEPGVINLEFSQSLAHTGFYFAPDPSSQKSCTIGGNVAENSGGPHTLAYGVTVNHVTGLEVVLGDGRVLQTGSKALETPGFDLTGILVGSEGTMAVVTAATLRLSRLPEAVRTLLAIYDSVSAAAETVSALTASGITPAALEMLDGFTLRAVEAATHAGYPMDSAAVLLIEVEGLQEEVEDDLEAIEVICRRAGARQLHVATDATQRALLWKGRKNAFGALGRISPNFYVMDGAIPRTRIADILAEIDHIAARHQMTIGNIFHAGDGNLHPIVFFDQRVSGSLERALEASREIIRACVEMGGSISGEHGIGMEKNDLMPLAFTEADLDFMHRIRTIWNPEGLLNPGKVLPVERGCQEVRTADPAARHVYQQWLQEGDRA